MLASGAALSTGLGELHNLGTVPVTVVDVRALDDVPGIDIVGALIYAHHEDSTDLANYAAFLPVDPELGTSAAVTGFIIPVSPIGPGFAVVVGYRATGVPRATISGFAVDYTVGGRLYTIMSPITFAVCAPPTALGDCKPE